MSKRFFILSFFLSIVFVSVAQNAMVTGTVTNFDNEPLDFVSVAVEGSAFGSYTNAKGKYALTVPVGDSIKIVFSMIGYRKEERTIKVAGNTNLNIMMRKEAIIDNITITGVQQQKGTITKIDVENVKRIASASGNKVEDMVKGEMGVSSRNELSSQYSVRGGSYDENIVYVNGIEVYRPLLIRSGQQEGLSFINSDMVGSIGFSTGGYDARYGDKMSSVLDITYRTPKSFEAGATASMMGGSAYVGTKSDKFSQISSLRYKTTRVLLGSLDVDAEYDPSFVDGQTFMTYNLTKRWELSFLGNVARTQYKYYPKTKETVFGTLTNAKMMKVYYDGWEDDKFMTMFGAFSLNGKISEKLKVGLTASIVSSDEQENYDINSEYWLTDANLESGGGAGSNGNNLGVGTFFEHARNLLKVNIKNLIHTGSFKVNNHDVLWGLTLQHEKIEDKIKEWEMRDSAGYSLPYDPNRELVQVYSSLRSDNELSSTRFSGYLQDSYAFNTEKGIISLVAGVRGSYWSFNKEFLFSPRASVRYVPNGGKYVLRLATGIYYQAPFYKEFQKRISDPTGDYVVLNNNIKSQRSFHLVLGGDYNFKAMDNRPFKFTTELYYKGLSNVNPYTVNNVKIRYAGENMGTGSIIGWDMKLFGEFVKGTDNWVSLSFMKAQQKINGINTPIPTDQRYNLSIFFQDYFPGRDRLKASIMGHLSQGLPSSPPNSGYDVEYTRFTAYRRVDIGFSWELLGEDFDIRHRSSFAGAFKNVWIGLDLFNLFNIKNISTYSWVTDIFNQQYPVPNYLTGRLINLKVTAEF